MSESPFAVEPKQVKRESSFDGGLGGKRLYVHAEGDSSSVVCIQ